MDVNGCVGLPYATTACFRANIEQSGLLHSARDHATIDCVSLVRRVSTEQCIQCKKPAPFLLQSTRTHTQKSRLRRAVVTPFGWDSPVPAASRSGWGRAHGAQVSSKSNRRKAGSDFAGAMGVCIRRIAIRRPVFCYQKKSKSPKISRLRR